MGKRISTYHRRSGLAPLKSWRSGQLLIEMLVALGILTIGFLGVTTLLSQALGLNRVVADNYTATYLATEGIEIFKNILDGNSFVQVGRGWNAGLADGQYEADFKDRTLTPQNGEVRPILFDPATHEYGYAPNVSGVPTTFKRTITITLGRESDTVHSVVEWTTRGGGSNKLDLEDHFFNWR